MKSVAQLFTQLFSPCLLFLFLFTTGISWFANARFNDVTVQPDTGNTCLTGWLPIPADNDSACVQMTRCFSNDTCLLPDNTWLPDVDVGNCPTEFNQARQSDPDIMVMIKSQTGNKTSSEYIPVQHSPIWDYGWSAANFGMFGLHIAKAVQKSRLLLNGKTSSKTIFFFTTYLTGALYHILEMPVVTTPHLLSEIPHIIAHSGMLLLSIAERLLDCSCCSQYKNGHNTMIAFHLMALLMAAVW